MGDAFYNLANSYRFTPAGGSSIMANRGYDVVVDVDAEVCKMSRQLESNANSWFQGDLGHTDLQEDNLEFHSSSRSHFPSFLPSQNNLHAKFCIHIVRAT